MIREELDPLPAGLAEIREGLSRAQKELPPKFFDDGAKGDLGKIRENWRAHLELDTGAFTAFARTLTSSRSPDLTSCASATTSARPFISG